MRKSKMNKFVVQLRKYWWVALGIVVIFMLVVGLIVMLNDEQPDEEIEVVETTEVESAEPERGVRFTNAEFVEKFVGEAGAKVAVADIEKGVYEFLNEGSYTAFVAGSDVEKGVSFPFSTLEFVLQVSKSSGNSGNSAETRSERGESGGSDGENSENQNFEVAIALVKDAYFGILVGPAEGDEAKLMIEYIRTGAEAGYDEEEAVTKLRNWAIGVRPRIEF